MTEELAATPAPEQVATAAPETEVIAPEQTTEALEEKVVKTFTQEELDAAIGKRLAMEQRKWKREQQKRAVQPPQVEPVKVDVSKYQTAEELQKDVESLVDKRAQELIQQKEMQRQQMEMADGYTAKEEAALDKYEDFEQVAYSENHQVTPIMGEAILSSDIGPEIAYYLGLNPRESNRIARLSPLMQVKEIGKLEAKIAAEPPKPIKTSSAPEPIAPVKARSASAPSYDTTDPRSVKTMSTSEWINAENARMQAKFKARYNR